MDQRDADEALRALKAVQGRLAQRAHWSWQRHAAFGGVMGAMVASYALPPPGPIIGLVLCCIAVGAIVARDRRRDGFFVNGYRAGRTRRVTGLLLLAGMAALAVAIVGSRNGLHWVPLAAGAVLFVVATLASKAWERVYREELKGKP